MNFPSTHVIAAAVMAVYGLLALVGGFMGYFKANSFSSLIAGGTSGLLLLLCTVSVFRYASVWSFLGSIIISLLLVGRFTKSLIDHRNDLGGHLSTTAGVVGIVMIVGGVLVLFFSGLALATDSRPPTLP